MIVPLDYPNLRIVGFTLHERDIRARSAGKETETVQWIEAIPDRSLLWDIGANVGAYSLIAGSRNIAVVAFEPHPENYRHLLMNVALNRLNVMVLPVAVWHKTAIEPMRCSSADAGTAFHVVGADKVPGTISADVVCMPLDQIADLLGSYPTHVKIDVDGAEVQVLRGARDTLHMVNGVLVETTRESTADVAVLLRAAGLKQTGRFLHQQSQVTNEVWGRP